MLLNDVSNAIEISIGCYMMNKKIVKGMSYGNHTGKNASTM